ncbi:MAG: Hsp20/alpha crystallin family protein [Actinomycetota bacterium]|nr:Hsp20/alpha crystallin family protein [Actinomycetota bacterium]
MARDRDRLAFERMRREVDALFGDPFARPPGPARRGGFSPRVDVFYEPHPPRAVVHAELAGIDMAELQLEIEGRLLVLTGQRPAATGEGRVFQQLEIETGAFRRTVELGADVVADEATATYHDGVLRVELPLVQGERRVHPVPVQRRDDVT